MEKYNYEDREFDINPNKKKVIIINGKGGVGKDTLIETLPNTYSWINISTIDPIKQIAIKCFGWDGEKNIKGRKLLSDLKKASEEYNDLLLEMCVDRIRLNYKALTFLHIREPENIAKYKKELENLGFEVITMLVKRDLEYSIYGNDSDDNVEDYNYDVIFDNNNPVEVSIIIFRSMIKNILDDALIVDANNLLVLDNETTKKIRLVEEIKLDEALRAEKWDFYNDIDEDNDESYTLEEEELEEENMLDDI